MFFSFIVNFNILIFSYYPSVGVYDVLFCGNKKGVKFYKNNWFLTLSVGFFGRMKIMHNTEQKIGRYMIGVGCIMQHTSTGKILCLLRDKADFQKGEWELMYGRIDQHEDLFEALRREVKEEIGLGEFQVKKLLRVWHFYRGERSYQTEIHGFTFHCLTDSQEIKLSSEHSEYRWVEPKEALNLIKVEGIKEDVLFFMDQAKKVESLDQVAFSGVSNKIDRVL